MKKIFVTGATGYIGKKTSEYFYEKGFEIAVLVRKTSNLERIQSLVKAENIYVYDNNVSSIEDALKHFLPDVVFHFAACYISEHTTEQIDTLLDSNVKLSVHLLEAMKNIGIKCLVNTSTSWQNYKDEEYNPVSLYAATKQMVEDAIKYYSETWDINAISLAIYDTYGADDFRKKLFSLLKKAGNTGNVLEMSEGMQKLDYIYITDIVEAYYRTYVMLCEERFAGNAKYYLRSGNQVSLRHIVELYESVSGKKIDVSWGKRPYRMREVMDTYAGGDILPGWTPKVILEDGIRYVCGK